jgi:CRP-like cAMP-binding protein
MVDIDTLLAWGGVYKKIGHGQTVFHEGSQAHFYHQLVSGSVHMMNIDEGGNELIQDIREPGDSFGELPLFDGQGYAATALAAKDSVIIRLHKDTFHQLLEENPDIHFAFTRVISERLRFKLLFLKELSFEGPEHRISTLFNYFKSSKKNICYQCSQIMLTRQQIANMTGLRVETVIRTIKNMQEKGQLLINKGKVYC